MKRRNCLIVDDKLKEISEILDKTKRIAGKNSIDITFSELNPLHDKFYKKNGDDQYVIDQNEIISFIKDEVSKRNFDLIITDYEMHEDFSGLDIIKLYRSYINSNSKFIIYSGNPNKIANEILQKIENEQIKAIDSLLKAQILRILDKNDNLDNVILEILNKQPLESVITNKLTETEPDLTFKSCYPSLKGRKMSEIAEIIKRSDEEAENFKVELVDQFVDYMLELNKDE
ncbi:hypothetical protein [Marinifilum flexuosum]|uniref:hypothetical protein n=1 Tax=Marinifilum flexuosum TaxID=1117708 RepID=UPI002494A62C|nr:hypothetical protein [Marinifilum flexuosum]